MPRLPAISGKEAVDAFERAGWTVRGSTGSSHVVLKKEGNPSILTIPVHKGKPIKKPLLLKQIKRAGLTVEEFSGHYR